MLRRIACVGLLVTLAGCRDTIVLYDGVVDAAASGVADAGWQRDDWMFWPDPNCKIVRKSPSFSPQWQEIMIVLDRSTNMQATFSGSTSKLAAVQGALYDTIGAFQSRVAFGLELYPGDANGKSGGCYHNSCCAGDPSVYPQPGARNNISGYFCSDQGCDSTSADTPAHKALERVLNEWYKNRSGWGGQSSAYVLLLASSEPFCSADPASSDSCPAKSQATSLANLDVPVVVLPVGFDPRSNPSSCLVQISNQGVVPMPEGTQRLLPSPSSYNSLKETLNAFFKAVARRSCTLTVYDVIPESATTTVTIGTSPALVKDDPDGWSFDGPDRSQIKLSRAACDQFIASSQANISINYTYCTCDGTNACPH
jgi:hypothetical protein